jgi:hypothetical protein
MTMKKRGKILRDASTGPGLLMADGQQYSFPLEGVWKSETSPRPGLAVDMELGEDGTVKSVTAVPESRIAKEQAEQAMAVARAKGSAFASSAIARFGMPTLIAVGMLIVGWFFLSTISVNAGFAGKMDFSFWRVLAFINSGNALEGLATLQGNGSAGFYGLLAFTSLAGPFMSYFWKDKRAMLGGVLPLFFMLLVALLVRNALVSMTGGAPSELMDEARSEIMKQISVGAGAYISILAAVYLAFTSVKNFLVGRANS